MLFWQGLLMFLAFVIFIVLLAYKNELDTSDVTRVELIGDAGRIASLHNLADVKLCFQDDGQTLKIFVMKE